MILLEIFLLSHQDSNLDRQNQNLQCYHYTMRQSLWIINNIQMSIKRTLIHIKVPF